MRQYSPYVDAGTNGSSALVRAGELLGLSLSDFDALTNTMIGAKLGVQGGALVNSGNKSGMRFMFCGTLLDLDPDATVPGILSICKAGWSVIILLIYGAWVVRWACEVCYRFTDFQTGGVPNMVALGAGFGGNILGISVAVVVPVAIATLWAGLFSFVAGVTLSELNPISDAATAFTLGGNEIALYLLNSSFPVALAFGCAFSRITIPIIGVKMVILISCASRFLWGK
jgi:hypothetical protein